MSELPLGNLLAALPDASTEEVFELIVQSSQVRIERIVSQGQVSPAEGWYDQGEHEWVCVLQGEGHVLLEGASEPEILRAGDHLFLPAHRRHKVVWTAPEPETVWLAVFFT